MGVRNRPDMSFHFVFKLLDDKQNFVDTLAKLLAQDVFHTQPQNLNKPPKKILAKREQVESWLKEASDGSCPPVSGLETEKNTGLSWFTVNHFFLVVRSVVAKV